MYNYSYMSFYRNIGGMIRPSTRDELRHEVEIRLNRGQYNLNDIDTSKITDMNCLFTNFNMSDLRKIDISRWDVSNVVNMEGMFYSCINFNCDLSEWDVSNVVNMRQMFAFCKEFNSDLSKWDTHNVKVTMEMFTGCVKFNSDLSKWDVSRVENMSYMFDNCTSFNSDL